MLSLLLLLLPWGGGGGLVVIDNGVLVGGSRMARLRFFIPQNLRDVHLLRETVIFFAD